MQNHLHRSLLFPRKPNAESQVTADLNRYQYRLLLKYTNSARSIASRPEELKTVRSALTVSTDVQAEHKKRDKARKASSKPASRFEEEQKKRGLLDKYDEEEEEAAMLIGDQGDRLHWCRCNSHCCSTELLQLACTQCQLGKSHKRSKQCNLKESSSSCMHGRHVVAAAMLACELILCMVILWRLIACVTTL